MTTVVILQEDYQREGIQWKNIKFIDSTGYIQLFHDHSGDLFHDHSGDFAGGVPEGGNPVEEH